MWKLIWLGLLGSSPLASAASATCQLPGELGGEYVTQAARGYTPNRLMLTSTVKGQYKASLTSYWAPTPNDNGTRGTIGDFQGELHLLSPWSCVGSFSTPEKDCHLLLRFVGKRTVYVDALGRCEQYHGERAYPIGRYEKVLP